MGEERFEFESWRFVVCLYLSSSQSVMVIKFDLDLGKSRTPYYVGGW